MKTFVFLGSVDIYDCDVTSVNSTATQLSDSTSSLTMISDL